MRSVPVKYRQLYWTIQCDAIFIIRGKIARGQEDFTVSYARREPALCLIDWCTCGRTGDRSERLVLTKESRTSIEPVRHDERRPGKRMRLPFLIFHAAILVQSACTLSSVDCIKTDVTCSPSILAVRNAQSNVRASVSGVITGLVSNGITLQNNGADDLVQSANGGFSFSTPSEIGAAYNVTIKTQPSDVRCIVQNGSGTFSGVLTNMVITCPLAVFGGVTYMRCTAGQVWNSQTGDCTGTGSAGSNYGASVVQFCSVTTNDCNSLFNGGPLTAGANGQTSTLFLACDALNPPATYGITTWRAASKGDLQLIENCGTNGATAPDVNGDYQCNPGFTAPTVRTEYFPNTVLGSYSSGTADGCCPNAYWVHTYTNGAVSRSSGSKTIPTSARCVSP